MITGAGCEAIFTRNRKQAFVGAGTGNRLYRFAEKDSGDRRF